MGYTILMIKGNLFIARHWETESNQTWAIVWIKDVTLTENWVNDAHVIWSNIGVEIDLIITSPQLRANMSSNIIRKYCDSPIVEHPILHPQNFWVLEWLTLTEAQERWLGEYIHWPETDKYLHEVEWWETPKEMEERTIPEIHKLLSLAREQSMNILLLSHNSISRCLMWNVNWISPTEWINTNIWSKDLLQLEDWWISSTTINSNSSWIEELLRYKFNNDDFEAGYWESFLNNFAILSAHEEVSVLKYLLETFPWNRKVFLNHLIELLENTITLNNTIAKLKSECEIPWVYSVLQFWSSVFWKNYSVKKHTDLDIEIMINDNFDINWIAWSVLGWYYWDIIKDFWDFLNSWADYFSFKAYYEWRLVDFRITYQQCFDKICSHSLKEWEVYVMKEFRKQFRENGIIGCRNDFNWTNHIWNNNIEYSTEWQIIHYPLFMYKDWRFIAWNNLDKYCSFTDTYINEIDVKKKLFDLRKTFNYVFWKQKEEGLINKDANISDIFIRKSKFPKFLIEDLEYKYKIYRILFQS